MAEPTTPQQQPPRRRRRAGRPLLMSATIALGGLVALGLLLAVVLGGGLGGAGGRATSEPSDSSRPASATAGSEDVLYPPGSPDRPASERPVIEPEVSESDVTDELRATFGDDIAGARIQVGGDNFIRVDVDTRFEFSAENAAAALDVAKAAAESRMLVDSYGTLTISAYVWPADGKVYMTRATATWVDGALAQPMSTYADSALQ